MDTEKKKFKIMPLVGFLSLLFLISLFTASYFSFNDENSNLNSNVAIIKIYGEITTTGSSGFLDEVASSNDVLELLDEAAYDDNIKAIVLDINSGGGSGVASEEIGNKLKSINKVKVAWIRDIGASGAYWVASNTDYIVASKMSLVGSIGVTGSYLEFSKFLDNYNITYRRLVSGKYKDSGSPLKELTSDEEKMMQSLIDELNEYFMMEISENRNISIDKVKKLATGEVFTGVKAKEFGLIDETGGIDEVSSYLEYNLNTTVSYALFEQKESFTDLLRKFVSEHGYSVGTGIGSFLYNKEQNIRI